MSGRFENGYTALVISCVVALLCIAIVSWTVPYSKGYQAADKDHQSAYASDQAARESREECSREPGPQEAIECYDEKVTADRDHQRAEQDLDAQREMANWAEGVLWATAIVGCLTVGVAGLGAFWVKETLSATRDAVRAADDAVKVTRDIGEKQVRAYVTIKNALLSCSKGKLYVAVEFFNSGASPALGVEYQIFGKINRDAGIEKIRFGEDYGKLCPRTAVRDLAVGEHMAQEYYQIQFTSDETLAAKGFVFAVDISDQEIVSLILEVRYNYRTVFSESVTESSIAYWDLETPLGRNVLPDLKAKEGRIYPVDFTVDFGRDIPKTNGNEKT